MASGTRSWPRAAGCCMGSEASWDVHLLMCSVPGDQSNLLIPPVGQSNAPGPQELLC